jgi:hypothetical protein
VEVQRTPDADVAMNLVRDSRSRLLITEAQTASVDGLALAACARRQRPQLPLIFLADTRTGMSSARAADLGGSHLIDKPPRLDHFVDLVARVLQPPCGFRGELSTSGVLELVQLVALTTPTGALQLSGPAGVGTLWFENGSVVHAAIARERGMAAVQRMLRWRAGNFSVDATARAPEHSVTTSTTELLLDVARMLDEEAKARSGARELGGEAGGWTQGQGVAPALPAHEREEERRGSPRDQNDDARRLTRESHVAIRAVRARDEDIARAAGEGGRAAEHFEGGLQAVWRKAYAEALPQWERAAALEPENRLYQHNLMRLRRLIDLDHEHGSRR